MTSESSGDASGVSAFSRRFIALSTVVVLFLLTRLYLLTGFAAWYSETLLYFDYAYATCDLGRAPYAQVKIEYPPLAYELMTVPRWFAARPVASETLPASDAVLLEKPYDRNFRYLSALAETAGFLLFALTLARRRPAFLVAGCWAYLVCSILSAHVLHARLDAGLLFLLMMWAYAWTRAVQTPHAGWTAVAMLAIGLGIAYKLVPIVFDWLDYHAARGLEIGSAGATLLMALSFFGYKIEPEQSFGAWNIAASSSAALASATTWLLALVLMALALWAIAGRKVYDRDLAFRYSCLTILSAVLLSKVFSPQYLVWAVPLALLLAADSLDRVSFLVVACLLCLLTALTTAVFPYLFFAESVPVAGLVHSCPYPLIPALHALPCSLLIARNALFLAVWVWLAVFVLPSSITDHRPSRAAL